MSVGSSDVQKQAYVIGGGVVGVSTGIALRRAGYAVTLLERGEPGREASFGNAGVIAVTEITPMSAPGIIWNVPKWLLDPLGPLALRPAHVPALLPWLWRFWRAGTPAGVERAAQSLAWLMDGAWQAWPELLREAGMSGEVTEAGALTVYETDAAFQADAHEWALKRRYGIESQALTAGELAEMEPDLAGAVQRGVLRHGLYCPKTAHVSDPWRIVSGLAAHFRALGGVIEHAVVAGLSRGPGNRCLIHLGDGRTLDGDTVALTAGPWSPKLLKPLGIRALVESERGYNTTLPQSGVSLKRPVTSAEGKFVLSPLAIGLRIGGAAEFAGLDADANYRRSEALLTIARRYLPDMNADGGTQWMGQRPSTPDSLPVIGRAPGLSNLLLGFGHGHLGLTGAAVTGSLLAALAQGQTPAPQLSAFAVERF